MSYTEIDYPTKKAVKEAISSGTRIRCYNPGLGGSTPTNGTIYLEGPHYPKPHKWYGKGIMKDGFLVKIS